MPKGFQHLLQHPTAKKRCTSIVSLAERKESKEEKEDEPLKTENSEGRGDRSKLEPAVNVRTEISEILGFCGAPMIVKCHILSNHLRAQEDPDFDDLELTPDLYQELGIDEDELEDDLAFRADDLDPLG